MSTTRITGARTDFSAKDTGVRKVSKQIADSFAKQERQIKKLRAEAARSNKTFKTLQGTFKGFAASAAALVTGGLGASALIEASKEAADFSSKLVEGARNTGLLATELEAISAIMEQDGIGFQATTTALATFQKRIAEAEDGLATSKRAFDNLGLSLDELKGKTPRQQFVQFAEALAQVEDQTRRQQIAQDLLGRAGKQIVGTIHEQAGAWNEVITRVDAATKTTDAQYESLKNLRGEFTELDRQLRDMSAQTLTEHTASILQASKSLNKWKIALQEFLSAGLGKITPDPIDLSPGKLKKEYDNIFKQIQQNQSELDDLISKGQGGTSPGMYLSTRINQLELELKRYANLMATAQGVKTPKPDTSITSSTPKTIYERSSKYMGFTPQGTKENVDALKAYRMEIEKITAVQQKARETAVISKMARGEIDPGLQIAVENQKRLADEAERTNAQIAHGKFVLESYASTAIDGFFNAAAGVDSLGESMRRLAADISGTIAKQIILNSLFGVTGISGTAGGKGLFESIGGFFSRRESGGPVQAGVPYIVGERRPELFVPNRNGTIIPNVPVMAGGDTVTNNISVSVGPVPGESTAETERRLIGVIDQQIKNSFRNIGRASPERLALRRAL